MFLVEFVDRAGIGVREPHRPRHDGGQNRRKIERRVDRLADLAERLQLLHRARELAGAFTQLFEQSGVLDCDNSLLCEIADQFDLLVGEWTNFLAKDIHNAD